jgi:NTE family protein
MQNGSRPKKCDLVLEGGGVKGIGLAGAYSVLEEQGFAPSQVAGTSAGAISAALIAAGYTAEELKRTILDLDYRAFEDKAWDFERYIEEFRSGRARQSRRKALYAAAETTRA